MNRLTKIVHVLLLMLFAFTSKSFAQKIDWSKMPNTTWKLQCVYDAKGKVIQHSNEELCFNNNYLTSDDNSSSLIFSWYNLPIGGNILDLDMSARDNIFAVFDFPDNKSAVYYLVSSWDPAAQTITIVDNWGTKRIFKCSAPIDLGQGFTIDTTSFLGDGKKISNIADKGWGFLEEGNVEEAYEHLIEPARAGHSEANIGLYILGNDGNLKQFNDNDPTNYLYMAGIAYNAKALGELGIIHKRKARWGKAFTALRIAASTGYGFAQIFLGKYIYWGLMDFYQGDNGPVEAASMMHLASEGEDGDPEALFWMGVFYLQGYGVEKSLIKAIDCFKRGALNGSCKSQYFLGNAYYDKSNILGLDQDYSKAYKYLNDFVNNDDDFWKDYDQSDSEERDAYGLAYRNLSTMYRFGRGCSKNESKADEMIRLANTYGNPDAEKINQWLFGSPQ